MNPITRTLNVDNLLLLALQEDISSEDVTTNAVMPKACQGTVQLLCKQDGVIAGMEVFARVFTLLDEQTEIIPYVKDPLRPIRQPSSLPRVPRIQGSPAENC